ncbi:uncharacterized protein LOC110176672 [Drosophila serrata]|uniref:uncharacterized protein LOC110176672 n=1 Tax=Drosophila serrata TaxID=7274 RepID=UPI000A1D0E21|nr:uncharacterized protein LOC110176672 [Drosophila serrata]
MAQYNPTILKLMLLMVLAVNARCDFNSKVYTKRSLPAWRTSHALGLGPTPSEVINAISVAKQASANVLIAQQHLQAAKENVLNQQRIATEKQTQAVILKQTSKAAVAHAAAHATAVEVHKTEAEAARLGHLARNAHQRANPAFFVANNNFSGTKIEPIGFGGG